MAENEAQASSAVMLTLPVIVNLLSSALITGTSLKFVLLPTSELDLFPQATTALAAVEVNPTAAKIDKIFLIFLSFFSIVF